MNQEGVQSLESTTEALDQYNIQGHHHPTPKQLRNILKLDTSGVAIRWYDLGMQLLDDDAIGVLDVIKTNHPNDVTTCCNEMFKKWLEMQHDASWSQLVMALNNIALNTTADNVNKLIKNGKSCSDIAKSDAALSLSNTLVTCAQTSNHIDKPCPCATNSDTTVLPSNMTNTPPQACRDFAFLMTNIINELKKNEANYLESIKTICAYLTVSNNPNVLLFNEKEQETIEACNNIRTLFTKHLRHCWRYDEFSILKYIIQLLGSDNCEKMLNQYEKKLNISMKLKDIHEHCTQEKQDFPPGYHKMVAIIKGKLYSRITKEEYDKLKKFVLKHCEVEEYFLFPFCKAAPSSLILEWFISATAVTYMVETATRNANMFIMNSFVYLRISSHVIFDKRINMERRCRQLITAANNGYVSAMKTLIHAKYVHVNSTNTVGHAPLHLAALNGHDEAVETLIKAAANINVVEKDGWTPLHYSALNGHVKVVETLIKSGTDISVVQKDGCTALHFAAQNGHVEIVDALIKSGAVISIFEKKFGCTPLHLAVLNGHVEVVDILFKSGADINAGQKDGYAPMHIAVKNNYVEVVDILINSGADINVFANVSVRTKVITVHYSNYMEKDWEWITGIEN